MIRAGKPGTNAESVRLALVSLGGRTLGRTAYEVFLWLEERGWVPAGEHPEEYIAFLLSSRRDLFEPGVRGTFRLKGEGLPTEVVEAVRGRALTLADVMGKLR